MIFINTYDLIYLVKFDYRIKIVQYALKYIINH